MPSIIWSSSNYGRRVLISQDHREVYLTFAEYDDHYGEYIRNENLQANRSHSFLTMNECGPLHIDDSDQMTRLGVYILALTRQQFLTEANFIDLESSSKDAGKPSDTSGKKGGKA